MKQLAIIGPTASGKSDLAIAVALQIDAYILSIDSLSIYKEINIVSAKPSIEELNAIKHYGIDLLYPNEYFSVELFIQLYKDVVSLCKKEQKNLVIVGGSTFYLKSLMQGLSQLPSITTDVQQKVRIKLQNLENSYAYLQNLDPLYMQKIASNDRYRIEKAFLIYEASQQTPTEWFQKHPPKALIKELPIFNILVEREILKKRIEKRTAKMFAEGLVDEVCTLEKRYSRLPNAMGSIGVVEVLDFLDGKLTKEQMLSSISTHTAQLAKRQQTFNKTQFSHTIDAPLEELEGLILTTLKTV